MEVNPKMSQQLFLPESMYKIDSQMSLEKLSISQSFDTVVTGNVRRIDSKLHILEVDLGNSITGMMTYEEATIYPILKEDGDLSPNLYHLVGKNIRAKVIGFDTSGKFVFLSRKQNMLRALEFFKKENHVQYAAITAFSRLSAFLDIGGGILGRSHTTSFSPIRFKNVKDVGFKVGDLISCSITSFSEEMMKFDLSRVALLPKPAEVLSEGDVVKATVFDPVFDNEGIGYFVLIDKNFCGIVNSSEKILHYGENITVFIKKIKENGNIKLTLIGK